MRLLLLSVRVGRGHSKEGEALTLGYLRRLTHPFAAEARAFRSEKLLLEEVASLRRTGSTAVWLADARGKMLSSEQWAEKLGQYRDGGKRNFVIAIGPPDGWSAATETGADMLLSLGAMTLPHELARIVIAEQIYRASTILSGHPYHLGHE